MFRFVLTAYLSLIAAFGPALCCCSLDHLAGMGAGDRCCVAKKPDDHHHEHVGDGHTHHHHAHAPTPAVAQRENVAAGTPQVSSDRHCECNRDVAQVPGLPRDGVSHGELKAQLVQSWVLPHVWVNPALILPTTTANCCEQAPAPLYGREILRAYQILVI